MAEKMFTNETREKLVEEYTKKLNLKLMFESAEVKNLAEVFTTNPPHIIAGKLEEILASFKAGETPESFINRTAFKKLLTLFIPDKLDREKYLALIKKSNKFQYSTGYNRRTVRTKNYAVSIDKCLELMYGYFEFGMFECSLSDYILGNMSDEKQNLKKNGKAIWHEDMLIAAELDYELEHGKDTLHNAIENIILSDNNTAVVTVPIIRGIIQSSDVKLHELLGKFLLAARLQEGVRQAICENMDCGTEEAFLTLFNVICENDLIRYSSVKRAVATWIGMFNENAPSRISNKTLELMKKCLSDKNVINTMLKGNDAMEIVTALWALGFREVEDAISVIRTIIESGTKPQLLAVAYYNMSLYSRELFAPCAEYAMEHYADDLEIAAAFLPTYLENVYEVINAWPYEEPKDYNTWHPYYLKRPLPKVWFDGDVKKASLHVQILKNLYDKIEKKEIVFSPSTFPWYSVSISKSEIANRLCIIAARIPQAISKEITYEMLEHAEGFVSAPSLKRCLKIRESTSDKDFAVKTLKSKSLRFVAVKLLEEASLSKENYLFIESLLRYKDNELRTIASNLICEQTDKSFTESIFRLLAAKSEEEHFAGLDFILRLKEKDKKLGHNNVDYTQFKDAVLSIKNPSSKEQILISNLFKADNTENKEQTLPTSIEELYDSNNITQIKLSDLKLDANTFDNVCNADKKKLISIIAEFDKLIIQHRTDQYKDGNGNEHMLGDKGEYRNFGNIHIRYIDYQRKSSKITDFPFSQMWIDFYNEHIKNPETLFQLCILSVFPKKKTVKDSFTKKLKSIFTIYYEGTVSDSEEIIEQQVRTILFGKLMDINAGTYEYFCQGRYSLFSEIISALCVTYCNEDFFSSFTEGLCKKIMQSLSRKDLWYKILSYNPIYMGMDYEVVDNNKVKLPKCVLNSLLTPLHFLFPTVIADNLDDEKFSSYFKMWHALALHVGYAEINKEIDYYLNENFFKPLRPTDYMRAYRLNLITLDTIYYGILKIIPFTKGVCDPAFYGTKDRDLFAIYRHITDTIAVNEIHRGDAIGSCSKYAPQIKAIYGVNNVINLIQALGKTPFERTSSGFTTRTHCLSHLISVSRPLPDDTAENMEALIKKLKINEQKLYDLAMYAPAWIPLLSKVLNVPELERGCYYFMAHMKSGWNYQRDATLIAKYTPLTIDELDRGAFDLEWFTQMYDSLGEEIFNKLYLSAKYISDGAKHSRARKFADAALGRVTEEELEKEIERARNKDLVMSYPLIPIKQAELNERILHRYEFLQKFKKESQNFGAQRRQSEGEAFDIALENLSRAAGYTDVNRLNLNMECRLMESLCSVFEFQETKNTGYSIRIATDEKGKPFVECRNNKDQKILKSVPSSLKKDELVLEIHETYKRLKTQHERTRTMLENFMTESVYIPAEEIAALQKNPVISPIINTLLFISDKETTDSPVTGFLIDKEENYLLRSYDGSEAKIMSECLLRIAHPFDLFKGGHWHEWQKYIFEKQIIQPFKQVFRELYVKLTEELDKDRSYMFAGNQIQPQKAVATLRGRRWIAGYEEGLQKVFYKQNLIAEIYAQADWFSPADAEAPAIEFIGFSRRLYKPENDEKPLCIKDIPDIIYSEIMRDVDLAVSVAHAGAVDPETSHSTIEMRRAICEFTLPLFKIENVRFDGNFALIDGRLASYSVHLGSGLVRQIAGSAINTVAVHSQQRGKLFLPFVDEDPKTAEIISKILTFARDEKIKDPYILDQINRG